MKQPTELLIAAANEVLRRNASELVARDVLLTRHALVVRLAAPPATIEGEWRDTTNETEVDVLTLVDWWQRERAGG